MTKLFADIMNLEKSRNPFHSFGWNKGMPDNSAISWQKPMLLADTWGHKAHNIFNHKMITTPSGSLDSKTFWKDYF